MQLCPTAGRPQSRIASNTCMQGRGGAAEGQGSSGAAGRGVRCGAVALGEKEGQRVTVLKVKAVMVLYG